ncbi:MAG: hypothetical protein ACHQNT_08420 [Bacteroidia bacterium]
MKSKFVIDLLFFFLIFLLLFLIESSILCAQNYNLNNHVASPRIYLYGGMFMPTVSTTVRVDSKTLGTDTSINPEDELAFDARPKVLRLDAIAGSGSQFAISYMNIQRDGNAYITRDIVFGDTVYHAGGNTSAYFNTQIFGGSWRFAIINNRIWTAGISFGMRWMDVNTGITFQSEELQYSDDENVGVPAPLLGLHGSVYITPRLLGRFSLEYFRIHSSSFYAKAADHRFSAEYYFLKNLGAGVSYSIIDYEVNKFPFNNEFSGEINYSLKGFSLFVAARF